MTGLGEAEPGRPELLMEGAAQVEGHGSPVCPDCEARRCEQHCGAANKQSHLYGPWCGNRAGKKTNHVGVGPCYLHTGNTASQVAAARKQLAKKALAVHLRDLTYEPVGDPIVALGDMAAKWLALADWAVAHAAELDDAAQGAMLELAMEVGKQARACLADCGRLGLEERRVRIEEDKLDLMAAVMRRAWVELGQDQDDPRVQAALDVAYREILPES